MGTKKSIKKSIGYRLAFILIAAAIISIGIFVQPPTGLEVPGWRMLMLVVAVVVMFISECMPVPAVCVMIVVLLKYLGIMSFSDIQKQAWNTTIYFIMVSFGIAAAMKKTNLSAILLRFLFKFVKGSSKKLIAVMTILTAIISTVVNNGVAQVVIITIVLSMFSALGNPEPGTSRLCKGIMLGVCVGSQTGGLALPASNAVNVVLMDLAESIGGTSSISFFQWCLFGVPAAIILTAFAAWFIGWICKPEDLTQEQLDGMDHMFENIPEKLGKNDWVFIGVMGAMIVLWVSCTWVKALDIATIAMMGLFVLMMPGVGIINAKDYYKDFQGSMVVVLTCLFPMAKAMASSGAGEWVINNLFAGAPGWSPLVLYIMAAFTAFVVHLLVPSGSANAALSAMIIGPVAVSCGIPAVSILFIIGMQAGCSYLLPVDGIWAYTLGYGYYDFSDPMKKLWPMVLVTIAFAVAIVPLLTGLYGAVGLI